MVVVPIGFVSDHMEVLYDLDYAARKLADELGIRMTRVSTVGAHPRFVRMIRELVLEKVPSFLQEIHVLLASRELDAVTKWHDRL